MCTFLFVHMLNPSCSSAGLRRQVVMLSLLCDRQQCSSSCSRRCCIEWKLCCGSRRGCCSCRCVTVSFLVVEAPPTCYRAWQLKQIFLNTSDTCKRGIDQHHKPGFHVLSMSFPGMQALDLRLLPPQQQLLHLVARQQL